MCWAIWTCRKGRLYFWVPGSWVAGPLAHLSLSPAAPPLTFAYPSDAAALKTHSSWEPWLDWSSAAVRAHSWLSNTTIPWPLWQSLSLSFSFFLSSGSIFPHRVWVQILCLSRAGMLRHCASQLVHFPATTAASSPGFPRYPQTLDY